jgi:glycosyl transferase family 25
MKTFIITLLESNLSKKLSSECILQANKFNISPIVFPAVNGLIDGNDKMSYYGIKPFMIPKMNVAGVIGCFLSHFELWMKCVELGEPILVLEHDGYFLRGLPTNINDHYLDVLHLDPFVPTLDSYNQRVEESLNLPISFFNPTATGIDAAGEFVVGAYGYCIKPAAAYKLINFSKTVGSLPTDVLIGRNVVDLKSTSVSIIRLHPHYNSTTIHTDSSTAHLGNFLKKI